MPIEYINTDLDVESTKDLNPLAVELEKLGVSALNVMRIDNDRWVANFETAREFDAPESCIHAMLDAIDQLSTAGRDDWQQCAKREFNIGIRSGAEPHSLGLHLSNPLLRRVADEGATVGMTIYRDIEVDKTDRTQS